ncbi:hypothetical protein E5843_12655 [Luteimonas yindakuii]|uniref:hypothetical protein n=1 Tax=Luteimonas yindakuii TaxID=2565782 RepID=UPI0011077FCA|nr:hypothetical protein [Luteimonas yindakuii]QCO68404.2 hypothetical protein E5843_12655 [Luteimonas yindakuii]
MKALVASLPGALLPWLLDRTLVPVFLQADVGVPALTAAWAQMYPLAFAWPLLVAGIWWLLRRHPLRDRLAAGIAWAGSVSIDAVSILAVFLLVLAVPASIA